MGEIWGRYRGDVTLMRPGKGEIRRAPACAANTAWREPKMAGGLGLGFGFGCGVGVGVGKG